MTAQISSATSAQNTTANPTSELVAQLEDLFAEVHALAIRLRQENRRVQINVDVPFGGQSVLGPLGRFEALTVPQIARLNSTSRQNIQTIVNRLHREGWVELFPNPAHKRSELVRLTERGVASLDLVARNSEGCKHRVLARLTEESLTHALQVLRSIREALCEGPIPSEAVGSSNENLRGIISTKTTATLSSKAVAKGTQAEQVQVKRIVSDENELPVSLL